jgi:MarR family transcriptional regulator, organic hydroperoxide resistance regulator
MEKAEIIKRIIEDQRVINRVWRQYDPEVWMGLSLTIAQVKSLFFISNAVEVNFRKLAAALKVTPSNVTGIIDRLVEQDLVSRTENPADRRMLMLKLTDKGENLIVNLREQRTTQMTAILTQMTQAELDEVSRGTTILSRAVEGYSDQI